VVTIDHEGMETLSLVAVATPQLISVSGPAGAALSGLVAAFVVHAVAYYTGRRSR
jgi:hypothetical protein